MLTLSTLRAMQLAAIIGVVGLSLITSTEADTLVQYVHVSATESIELQ